MYTNIIKNVTGSLATAARAWCDLLIFNMVSQYCHISAGWTVESFSFNDHKKTVIYVEIMRETFPDPLKKRKHVFSW